MREVLKFQRNTHDEQGIYRGDDFFGKVPALNTIGVHVFDGSGAKFALSLDECISKIQDYQHQLPEENPQGVQDVNTLAPLFLSDLAVMLKHQLVVISPSS